MRKVLNNGITVITEKIDYVRSVSLGVWIKGGSCADRYDGIAHYAEHMAFKGTKTRPTEVLAQEFDEMGGYVNAYTSKCVTCYYGKFLDEHLSRGLKLLADMVLNPAYKETETNNERKVILEEIAMYEDTPDDLVMGRLSENVWQNSPLGKEILGTENSVKKITPENLRENLISNYTGANIVISACGHLNEEGFIEECESLFANAPVGKKASTDYGTVYTPSLILTEKQIEQNHIGIGFEGVKMNSAEKYSQMLFSSILGGGMSSRLFQSVREELGLVYSISSQYVSYPDAGLFSIYLALNKTSEEKALSVIRNQLDMIKTEGITETELTRAKEQLKASLLIDLEDTSAKMKIHARDEIFRDGKSDIDKIIEKISAVTKDDIKNFANSIINYNTVSLSVVGSPNSEKFYKGFFV